MAVKITHKTNATAEAVPAKTAIVPGEFAINTADGELFFKQLIDPALGDTEANSVIFAVRRPPVVDGGEITGNAGEPDAPSTWAALWLADTAGNPYTYDWYN
jgi:hypothetical protein